MVNSKKRLTRLIVEIFLIARKLFRYKKRSNSRLEIKIKAQAYTFILKIEYYGQKVASSIFIY